MGGVVYEVNFLALIKSFSSSSGPATENVGI